MTYEKRRLMLKNLDTSRFKVCERCNGSGRSRHPLWETKDGPKPDQFEEAGYEGADRPPRKVKCVSCSGDGYVRLDGFEPE